MARIKVRVSSGVFEVSLLRVMEENGSVEVLWDTNVRREFKWGSVILGPIDAPVQQKPLDGLSPPEGMANPLRRLNGVDTLQGPQLHPQPWPPVQVKRLHNRPHSHRHPHLLFPPINPRLSQ